MKKRINLFLGVLMVMLTCFLMVSCTTSSNKTEDNSNEFEEKIYAPIIEKYIQAITERWQPAQWNEAGFCPDILHDFGNPSVAEVGYCLIDLDNEGHKELLLYDCREEGNKSFVYDGFCIDENDQPKNFVQSAYRDHFEFCEGNVFHEHYSGSAMLSGESYYTFKDGQRQFKECVLYDGFTDQAHPWFYSDQKSLSEGSDGDDVSETIAISETEYDRIRNSYVEQAIPGKPLSEYSKFKNYDELIQTYKDAINEKWTKGQCVANGLALISNSYGLNDIGYAMKDINQDGQDELFIYLYNDPSKILAIYTIKDQRVSAVIKSTSFDYVISLCSDDRIKLLIGNGISDEDSWFYRLDENGALVLVEQISIKNGAYFTYDSNQQKKSISKDEYDQLAGKYAVQTISGKPLSE